MVALNIIKKSFMHASGSTAMSMLLAKDSGNHTLLRDRLVSRRNDKKVPAPSEKGKEDEKTMGRRGLIQESLDRRTD